MYILQLPSYTLLDSLSLMAHKSFRKAKNTDDLLLTQNGVEKVRNRMAKLLQSHTQPMYRTYIFHSIAHVQYQQLPHPLTEIRPHPLSTPHINPTHPRAKAYTATASNHTLVLPPIPTGQEDETSQLSKLQGKSSIISFTQNQP